MITFRPPQASRTNREFCLGVYQAELAFPEPWSTRNHRSIQSEIEFAPEQLSFDLPAESAFETGHTETNWGAAWPM